MKNSITINTKCDTCDGTGLYAGFAEGKGGAVVCGVCRGTGCYKISYKPFFKRKRRRVANGSKLEKVYLDRPIWTKEDGRIERKVVSPKLFYSMEEYKKEE